MCSNFEVALNIQQLDQAFGIKSIPAGMLKRKNQRPTNPTLVIGPNAQYADLQWGFQVDWNKQPLINARSETVLEKAAFAACINNRCIVPASAWFEWRPHNDQKLKNRIAHKKGDMLMFAALYDQDRVCILTQAAQTTINHIHHRMPVLLTNETATDWLTPAIPTLNLSHSWMQTAPMELTFSEDKPSQLDLF